MSCYIISYDLKTGGNYSSLHSAIKAYGTWAKITESTWAIVTDEKASQVRDKLLAVIEKDSRLFVVKSAGEAAWSKAMCTSEWLQNNLSK